MIGFWPSLEWVATGLLPARDREAVLGDVEEEGLTEGRRVCAIVGVAAHAHAEPWRDPHARLGSIALLAGGWLILHTVTAAARFGSPDPAVYSELMLQVARLVWSSDYLGAAAAAGLLVGHAPAVPSWAGQARGHAAVALAAPTAILAPHAFGAALAVSVLWFTTWFGDRARSDTTPGGPFFSDETLLRP